MANRIDELLAQLYHPGLKTIDPSLDRMEKFLPLIGSPEKRLPPVIHVAGTNGKGSLVAYLQAIFEAAGYTTHRYISPHLIRFNERITIAGKPISDEQLQYLLEELLPLIEQQPVTFFEATTALAFRAFAEQPADVLLLEVGMGGRLDATNVIEKPALTAITPIALDHCEFLGNTIAEIAYEKAGIIKKDVPCVVNRQTAEAANVIAQQAEVLSAPLYRHGREWQLFWEKGQAIYQSPYREMPLKPALAGRHQYDNAATAVACIDQLPQFNIGNAHIAEGLAKAHWPGRLQKLSGKLATLLPQGYELWLDGGHNPHGGTALAEWLKSKHAKETYLICGMIKRKDTLGYLAPLTDVTKLIAITIPNEPLSQPAEQVEMAARAAGIPAASANSLENALQTIAARAKTPAIICICGSLYLAGSVLAMNQEGI